MKNNLKTIEPQSAGIIVRDIRAEAQKAAAQGAQDVAKMKAEGEKFAFSITENREQQEIDREARELDNQKQDLADARNALTNAKLTEYQ